MCKCGKLSERIGAENCYFEERVDSYLRERIKRFGQRDESLNCWSCGVAEFLPRKLAEFCPRMESVIGLSSLIFSPGFSGSDKVKE